MRKLISKIKSKLVGRESGFTLTELAVAMLVVGILASVAVPSFLGSRNNAYDKEAQNSINLVMNAALGLYQNQGDFSDAISAQCGDSTPLAADLQKLEPNIDVIAAAVASTSARTVSVTSKQTWNSNAELLGCQAFFATALSSSGTCWVARFTVEGKFFLPGGTLAADLQKIEPNVDVIAAATASTSARTVSVDARRTYNSNAELLGCQAFFATALSSSGTCWIARFTVEGKFFQAGSIAPIVMAPALNTQNASIATWTLLQANGAAYAQIRARSNAADADNSVTLALTRDNCSARLQSTGQVADPSTGLATGYYAAPSEFYSSWRDVTGARGGAGN